MPYYQHGRFSACTACHRSSKGRCDAYVEKPFAETMEDNRAALKAIKATDRIVQIGSQRRSGANYHAANDFIRSGKVWSHYNGGADMECQPARPLAQTGAAQPVERGGYRLEEIFNEQAQ